MREFKVIPVLNGFIVKIGCKTVVFEGKQAIIDAFSDYVLYPEETEKKFLERAVNEVKERVVREETLPVSGEGRAPRIDATCR